MPLYGSYKSVYFRYALGNLLINHRFWHSLLELGPALGVLQRPASARGHQMRTVVRIIFSGALLTSTLVTAQQIMVFGIGKDSCGSFTLAIAKNVPTSAMRMDEQLYYTDTAAYAQWIAGYVTANEAARQPVRSHTDFNGVMMWIKNFCDSNPTSPLAHAAQAFVEAHRAMAKQKSPDSASQPTR